MEDGKPCYVLKMLMQLYDTTRMQKIMFGVHYKEFMIACVCVRTREVVINHLKNLENLKI